MMEALRNRHESGEAPRAVVAYQLFQTPKPVICRMMELAEIRPGMRLLEPSAGLGRLVEPMLRTNPCELVAVDSSADCVRELWKLAERVPFIGRLCPTEGDFLAMDLGAFDRVLMNPPFHMRSDIRHIYHALRHVGRNGILVGICMDTIHREEKLRHLCDHWEQLPAGTFADEGTQVPTILFRIRV